MKKRVMIDARMVGPLGHGIALYVTQLAQGLAQLQTPYEPFYLLAKDCPQNSFLRTQPHAESHFPFLSLRETIQLRQEIESHGAALYHTPSFASLLRYPCPIVQTVHDLNHLHFGGLARKIYYYHLLLPSLATAKAVLSVSEGSAHELRAWMLKAGVDKPVHVAPNAIEEFAHGDDDKILQRFGLTKQNYFFTLSNPKPHKNLEMLQQAYAAARAKRELPPLAISTAGENAHGILHTGPLHDAEVGALLRHAKSFFFPSLYEGFGRPPVEAALAGTIPVASSLAVHQEALAGVKEAIFLDPAAHSRWEEAFLRMANISDRVSQESKDWIRKTWSIEKLAKTTDEAYRAALA